jgi:hypothetical protein
MSDNDCCSNNGKKKRKLNDALGCLMFMDRNYHGSTTPPAAAAQYLKKQLKLEHLAGTKESSLVFLLKP